MAHESPEFLWNAAVRAADEEDPRVRAGVAMLLSELGPMPDDALTCVTKLVDDEDELVSSEAALALRSHSPRIR